MLTHIENKLLKIQNSEEFENLALELFHLHYHRNRIYRSFCNALEINSAHVTCSSQIPCMPVSLFKYHKILLDPYREQLFFETSGTTTQQKGIHYIVSPTLYEKVILKGFELFYGNPTSYHFLALVPNYLERPHSSLVYMIKTLIKASGSTESDFFLYNHRSLVEKIKSLRKDSTRTIFLIGTTFAIVDFLEKYPDDYHDLIIMETGGMKGRREEWPRFFLHEYIKKKANVQSVSSEYGMTELHSQAYSKQDGLFQTPPWMKIFLRDPNEPRHFSQSLPQGVIHIIDLANIYSCPFIATEDIGRWHPQGLEILGRLDFSELRGCSIMSI